MGKKKWALISTYRPPSQCEKFFLRRDGQMLDQLTPRYENFVIVGDLNSEENNYEISNFIDIYGLKNVIKPVIKLGIKPLVFKTPLVKYDPIKFCSNLRSNLAKSSEAYSEYENFNSVVDEVRNNHVPLKQKYLRANDAPFMTKTWRKAIMLRSQLRNWLNRHNTSENWNAF